MFKLFICKTSLDVPAAEGAAIHCRIPGYGIHIEKATYGVSGTCMVTDVAETTRKVGPRRNLC